MMKRILASALCVFMQMLTFEVACLAVDYKVIDLGVVSGAFCGANGLNETGVVVGSSHFAAANDMHACRWQLGSLPADLTPSAYYGSAAAINTSGWVVGTLVDDAGDHAFLLRDGVLYGLEGYRSSASDINDAGQVAGSYVDDGGFRRASMWQGASVQDLGVWEGTDSYAYSINESGEVVGYYYEPGAGNHAFMWENNSVKNMDGPDGVDTYAYGINDGGEVVGRCGATACLWDSGTMQLLNIGAGGGSVAQAVNNNGVIIGYSCDGGSDLGNSQHAFVWREGAVQYLDTLGGNSSRPFDINDSGWIVGVSDDADGQRHAVLWQPVPEPSSLLALASGVGLLAALRRRQRS